MWRYHGDKYYTSKIFLFCHCDGAIIVLQNTRGTVVFCICGEFQLQICTFSTCHCLSSPLHMGFLLNNTTGGVVFYFLFAWGLVLFRFWGFFLAETEHTFWEQHEYVQTLIFFFGAINTLLKEIPIASGYCNFKGCFPVCI